MRYIGTVWIRSSTVRVEFGIPPDEHYSYTTVRTGILRYSCYHVVRGGLYSQNLVMGHTKELFGGDNRIMLLEMFFSVQDERDITDSPYQVSIA
jgi:hypothetical protein